MELKSYLALMQDHPELFRNEGYPLTIIRSESEIVSWQETQRQRLSHDSLPLQWAEIGILAQDPYFIVLRDLVVFPDGSTKGYVRSIHSANLCDTFGVIMLPILENRVLLVNHFRHSTRQWHLEIPRGFGEPGLSMEANVARELEEEVGAEIDELSSLGILYPETGFESQRVEMFLARLASVRAPEVNEGIESFVWVTLGEFEDWIANGKINDGFTIAAYTRAKLKGLI
jgi:ADP-ribose pyrophosphatase